MLVAPPRRRRVPRPDFGGATFRSPRPAGSPAWLTRPRPDSRRPTPAGGRFLGRAPAARRGDAWTGRWERGRSRHDDVSAMGWTPVGRCARGLEPVGDFARSSGPKSPPPTGRGRQRTVTPSGRRLQASSSPALIMLAYDVPAEALDARCADPARCRRSADAQRVVAVRRWFCVRRCTGSWTSCTGRGPGILSRLHACRTNGRWAR